MVPRISLCMILRDEAELLPTFLEHARGAYDELVAVDTGSLDRTRELLDAAGARTTTFTWVDDFAAARNAGLALAQGDWILVLDADEFLSTPLIAGLRATAADETAGAASVVMRNRLPHGHHRDSQLLRFFRRDPSIRFCHAIHEDVSASVAASLARTGQRLVHLPGVVEHVGYERQRAESKGKRQRDVTILAALLAKDPQDLYSHYKQLEQARFWKDRPLWGQAAKDAEKALDAAPGRAEAHFAGELLVLIADGLFERAPHKALAWLEARAPRVAPHAALELRRGELCEVLGRPADAAAAFQRCLALAPVTVNHQLATVRPLLGLARLALGRGAVEEAALRVEQALALAPQDPESLVLALVLASAGGIAGARAWVEQHVARHGDFAELRSALADVAQLTRNPALKGLLPGA